jgi:hypothetical protein
MDLAMRLTRVQLTIRRLMIPERAPPNENLGSDLVRTEDPKIVFFHDPDQSRQEMIVTASKRGKDPG